MGAGGAVAAMPCARRSVGKMNEQRPNILLILADDMGYSDIGCYGGEIETPNLDKLAENGLRFTQFYNAARCCPTRASLLTGLYPHQTDVGHMVYRNQGKGYRGRLNNKCVTLAEVLKSAGYQTMMTGKWHVGHQNPDVFPVNRGFDKFYGIHKHVDSYFKVLGGCPIYRNGKRVIPPTENPPNELHPDQEWYTTNVFTDHALKYLDQADTDKPFFMYVAYNSPHWPLEAPDKYIKKYRHEYTSGWHKVRKNRLARMRKKGIIDENWKISPADAPEWDKLSEEDRDNLDFRRAIYAAQIDNMDHNIGRIIDKLKQTGRLDNTLILFLSDNGCSAEPENQQFGYNFQKNRAKNFNRWRKQSGRSSSQGLAWANVSNTPFRKYKKWTHEGGIATPLIAHWPERIERKGAMVHQPGHIVDIMATLIDVAHAGYPATRGGENIHPMEGVSLTPALHGRKFDRNKPIYWEHEGNWAIRDGKWKLVCDGPKGPVELYDLEADRTELNNLAEEFPGKVEELTMKWLQWANRANVLPWPYKPSWQNNLSKQGIVTNPDD